jgi:signal transduction histidine kinase
MPTRVRDFDWSTTPLGPAACWPPTLATAVGLCLASRLPMAVCWGPELTLVYNDAYAALLDGKHPTALGRPWAEVWSDLAALHQPLLTGVLSTGEAVASDDVLLPTQRHGYPEEAFFSVAYSPIRPDGVGPVGGVLITVTETTERVLAERRLRLLRDLAVSAATARTTEEVCADASELCAVHAHDLPFALLYLLGPTGDALLARPAPAALPGPAAPVSLSSTDDDEGLWPLRRVMRTGERLIVDQLTRRLPQPIVGPVWPERVETAVVLPIPRPGQDRPFGVLVAGITPRRPLDERYLDFLGLVASHIGQGLTCAQADRDRRHLAMTEGDRVKTTFFANVYDLFTQAPAPFCVLAGPDLVFELANPAFVRLVGHDHLVGKTLDEAVPELGGQGFDQTLREVLRTGQAQVEARHEAGTRLHGRNGGEDRYFSFVYSPLRAPGGAVDRVMVFAWEITDQVKARAELEKARQVAEEASSAKDQFLAMLGHELRNPLSPILTALQLMNLRGMRSREQEVIQRQVGHLVRLVDDLLDVARITRGKVELRREPVELASVVVRGIELASPLLEQRHQRLAVNVPPDGLTVLADNDRLAQVVSNLLTNAAKYSEPGSQICIEAGRVGDKARLLVRDEGIGIAPDMLDSIFESFVQHRQALDRASGGLGLGLAIVRSLVRLHGGTVRARSDGPGKGSEFEVELPLGDGLAVIEASGDSDRLYLHEPVPQAAPCPDRVLVVDDNQDGAEILAETLRELGHVVEIAHDGPSALEIAQRFRPQLALLDIGLPVMDGYELAGHLRELGPIRLVAVTGYGQETDRRRSQEAGFSAHLVKPVDLDVLTTVVRH